ncbi:hypothetical protein SAMN06296036_10266 [Pseudobacteriovorax antillogorgiicola]|uniref:Uncharacterized protein n=2 Tax=Pseudobacteriovorax antillogorgiicola TaxID=1513793 RepID=A0A1Y6B796_9BACT|nr:hypothetical protein EDD56_102377 [Pseudobacteriovorax antillogorgiicola]SME93943.1 hypothetical protein SAMN06296036_10266 [Pseudobacteriovorax antillogorgiicola]
MVPFRVFDREKKQMWQIINYHPNQGAQGSYLATKEDDDATDGDMMIIAAEDLAGFKFVDFLEEVEPFEG